MLASCGLTVCTSRISPGRATNYSQGHAEGSANCAACEHREKPRLGTSSAHSQRNAVLMEWQRPSSNDFGTICLVLTQLVKPPALELCQEAHKEGVQSKTLDEVQADELETSSCLFTCRESSHVTRSSEHPLSNAPRHLLGARIRVDWLTRRTLQNWLTHIMEFMPLPETPSHACKPHTKTGFAQA